MKNPGRGGRIHWSIQSVLLLFALSQILSFGQDENRQGSKQVEEARTTLEKWVETQQLISKEKKDWALGREILDERIDLVAREIASLRERIKNANESIAEADKKREALVKENEQLKVSASALSETVVLLEERTKALLKKLPDPIRELVKRLSQRIPEDPNNTKLSLGGRFQNIAGILNSVNKFAREITVTSEVRTLRDGTAAKVTALYVGIGHAYFTSGDGMAAGIGTGTDEGWVFTQANEAASAIADAVAVLKNEKPAEFVQLPVRIK